MVGRASNTDGGEDKEPGGLPASTDDKGDTATNSLNNVETGERRDHVYSTKHELYKNGVVDTSRLEDSGTVLQNISLGPNKDSQQFSLRRRNN